MQALEFLGLPGVGKTTVIEALQQRVPHTEAQRISRRSWLWLARRHPLRTVAALGRITRHAPRWSDRRALERLIRRGVVQELAIARSGADLLLIDEGVGKALWRELFRSPELVAAPWPALLSSAATAVVLDADSETLKHRIEEKPEHSSRHARLVHAPLEGADWALALELHERIGAALDRRRRVIRVDSTAPAGEVAAAILEQVGTLDSTGPAGEH